MPISAFPIVLAQSNLQSLGNSLVSTKTWNHLKPPTTIYNHLKNFNNDLQPPQKHLQSLANYLKLSKTI